MSQSSKKSPLSSETLLAIAQARKLVDFDESHETQSKQEMACRQIQLHRFCPPAILRPAIVTLTSPAIALQDEDFAERVLSDSLHEFSLRFISMLPEERQNVWAKLESKFQPFPQLLWRLNELKSGLLVTAPVPNPFGNAMPQIQNACDVFVMPPAAAARSLRRTCSEMTNTDRKARDAKTEMWEFSVCYPEHASLSPPGIMPLTRRLDRAVAKPKRPARDTSSGSVGSGGLKFLAVIFIVGLIRFLAVQSGTDNSRRYETPSIPGFTGFNSESQRAASKALLESMKEMDQEKIESIFGETKGKKLAELQEKQRAAEKRLNEARTNLDAIRSRHENQPVAPASEEFVTTLGSLKEFLKSAEEKAKQAENPPASADRLSSQPPLSVGSELTTSAGTAARSPQKYTSGCRMENSSRRNSVRCGSTIWKTRTG